MIDCKNILGLVVISILITNCKSKAVIDNTNEEIGVIDESDKIFRQVKDLSSICLGDYMKRASLLDKNANKVTEKSIKAYTDLFEDNAKVYADFFAEPKIIHVSNYATYALLCLENEGIDCELTSYEYGGNKFKPKKYRGGDFYRMTWDVEKTIRNGLDKENKPIRYAKERKINLEFVFYVYPELSKVKIMYINPTKED
jgi:hypothetical protein